PLLYTALLLHASSDTPTPPSFPTRRSSDLAAATARYNELSSQTKAAEKRMTEIAVLRTHIINYAKTREVYVAYRKAGYSKKFRADRKSTRLNSSHVSISYAVFCLKKKTGRR